MIWIKHRKGKEIFENHNFNALNLSFKNVVTAGRLKCCGMEDHCCGLWLAEDKKTNMWHGREKCCGLWPPVFPRSLRITETELLLGHVMSSVFKESFSFRVIKKTVGVKIVQIRRTMHTASSLKKFQLFKLRVETNLKKWQKKKLCLFNWLR